MDIQGQSLAREHCHIQFFKSKYYYTVKDLSYLHQGEHSQHEDSKPNFERGTWVTLPTNTASPLDWFNLHEENNWQHKFMFQVSSGQKPIALSFKQTGLPIDTLQSWLEKINFPELYDVLHQVGVKSILDLENFDENVIKEASQDVTDNFLSRLQEFKEEFDFERYRQAEKPEQLEIIVDGQGSKVLDGTKKVAIASKLNHVKQSAIIIFNLLELEHLILEIAPAFDLEETYMNIEDAPLLSPFGLQMRVHAPFLYNPLQPALFYRLLPQEEVLFQPGMLLHIGKMIFLLERFQTGAHDETGFRFR